MKCNYCQRELPNHKWKTSKRCIWCDKKYHDKLLREQKLVRKA